ncbi:transmembrane protein adipocyte-associated 1 [Tanacetum coccineum]
MTDETLSLTLPPTALPITDNESSSSSSDDCHGVFYTLVLSIPAALFILYLAFYLNKNVKKLNHRRSFVMLAYYLLLWLSALLNLAWCSLQCLFDLNMLGLAGKYFVSCRDVVFDQLQSHLSLSWPRRIPHWFWRGGMLCSLDNIGLTMTQRVLGLIMGRFHDNFAVKRRELAVHSSLLHLEIFMVLIQQAWQCTSGKAVSWNLLSLLTESGILCLEISLVAFLLQENYASGLETLAHTFMVSGLIVGVDILLKAIFVFGFHVPLFMDGATASGGKWGMWTFDELLLASTYGYILFVHYSKWRDKLPPRPAFYNYVVIMFVVNGVALFACALAASGVSFGLWLYTFIGICYHTLYLPFLYITFLSDFFQEEDLLLDNAYYSEMRDAGFFDSDWE